MNKKIKILIGICGFGNGHLNRQICIIDLLLKLNTEIVIATPEDNLEILNSYYPLIPKISIKIPWIVCNETGINLKETLEIYDKKGIDQYKEFLEFAIKVEQKFNGIPDIIMSDYEPNVSQYAYAVNKPLICLEQQSKFLFLPDEPIEHYSIQEEKSRLNYFFPKTDCRIISSFFDIQTNEENVFVLPPIINVDKLSRDSLNYGVVYFSPYANDKTKFIKILDVLKNKKDIEFRIFSKQDFPEYRDYKHLHFKHIDNSFKQNVANAKFVISSSGHQLISEAISLEKPMLLFPLNTYEQHYNCKMVEKYKLGKKIKEFSIIELEEFLNNYEVYKKSIKKYKQRNDFDNWDTKLKLILKDKYNIM